MFLRSVSVIIFAVFAATLSWADTTPNQITNIRAGSGTGVWLGTGNSAALNGQHPVTVYGTTGSISGASPLLDTSTTNGNGASGQIIWSYGQATVTQIVAINQALSGSGIQINGYNWSYELRNDNGGSGQGGVDSLTATSRLWNSNYSAVLLQESRTHNTRMGWTPFSSTVTAVNPYALSSVGNLAIEFSSRDAGFWAGYYGPQIRNVQASFNYSADPCVTNPASSPSCPGYADIVTSVNLVPNPDHWTTDGATINNTYAVNSALGLAGSSVRIHGFDYGYQYNLGSSYTQCTAFNQDGSCSWTMSFTPQVTVNFSVKDSSGNVIHSQPYTHSGTNTGNQTRSYQYRFGTSQNLLNLGAIGFTGTTSQNSALFGMTSRAVYTNDSCVSDPLISSSCPGYAAAYFSQQCSANPLYDVNCPGYAAAYFSQQCSANPLYDVNCPGYAAAYFSQQCTANQLYSSSCPGYAAAYLTYQCNIDQLYSPSCSGYQQAYLNQQCGINPLYDTGCASYQTAMTQCSENPLIAAYCPSYQAALSACANNGLAYTYCPTYQTELNYCSTDPLFNYLCPAYQTATTQCAVNPLYGSYCPGYQTATASCSANALNHSYCPGYTTALNACSTNPLSNTLCSGYTEATNACSANQLTYNYCPGYTTAMAACATDPQGNTRCPGYSSVVASGNNEISSTSVSAAEPVAQIAIDSKAPAEVALVSDSTVNSVITERATSTTPSPTATVSLVPQPSTSTEPAKATTASEKTEEKKENSKTADTSNSPSSSKESNKDQPKTARQEIQERRLAAAREKAVEAGKELAGKMGEAASLEAQTAVQNVVIQAMGFTPGFDTYNRSILPDAQGYKPVEIYPGQRVVDNPQGRRFMTGSDRLHADMVEQQYELRK